MKNAKILRFYLHDSLRKRAEAGDHNFISKISDVVEDSGFRVEFRNNSVEELEKSANRNGYSMFHMDDPFHDRALTIRRVYFYPFWQIESNSKRWEWKVARSKFEPNNVDRDSARRFFKFWTKRLYGSTPDIVGQGGFVYIPLQGRLLDHRSFQSCTPIEMIASVLEYETKRKVIVTLHPNETYSEAELSALENLISENSRLSLQIGQMEQLLAHCDYVVAQNSTVAFAGYFFRKPCVLFGRIDFHHIAENVHSIGAQQAIFNVTKTRHDYEGYLWWFLQEMAINAGRTDAKQKIEQRLLQAGWPL